MQKLIYLGTLQLKQEQLYFLFEILFFLELISPLIPVSIDVSTRQTKVTYICLKH